MAAGAGRPRTAASRRTRRLIVDAAIETLGQSQSAKLGEIAEAAGVSRSTLHRQFADRDELLAAVDQECRRRFDLAGRRARVLDGTGLEALERLAQEYLQLGPVLSLIFADNALIDPDSWQPDPDQRQPAASAGSTVGDAERHYRPDAQHGPGRGEVDHLQADGESGLTRIIERGHRDRSVDSALPADWIITTLWVLLFGAWQAQTAGVARHQVSRLLSRTLIGALGSRDDRGS